MPAAEVPTLAWSFGVSAELWARPDGAVDPLPLERRLIARLPPVLALDEAVTAAARRLMASGGEVPIALLAETSRLSPRQFRRRFTAAVGLSPKELARIWRLRRCALAALDASGPEAARWAELAAAHGFADQAHLVREFRHLLGLPPTAFARQFARITHRDLQPT
jgi:AraC-like DNA-binding protein